MITIAALLGMAAHLDGKGVAALDMVGMAQKGGAVLTHLKIAPTQDEIGAPRVSTGGARLVLGCDIVVTAGPQAIPTMRKGVTAAIVNRDAATTGDFTRAPDLAFPAERMQQAIVSAAGPVTFIDAGRLATRLVGDAIGANLFLVGYAWQRGLIPLTREAIERAIEVNDVQVAFNRQAFLWGRRAAHDLAAVEAVAGLASKNGSRARSTTSSSIARPSSRPTRTRLTPAATGRSWHGCARSRPNACPAVTSSRWRSRATCSS